jgi:hypothetical protein
LIQEIVQAPLETRHSQIVTQGFIAKTLRRGGFFARRHAELEGDYEEENEDPQNGDESDSLLAGKQAWG